MRAPLMRALIRPLALLLWLVVGGWAIAQDSALPLPEGVSGADRSAIQNVIRQQMQAFQHDDAAAAYAFAAPVIRQSFPDADQFMAMVRRGYPAVYRPRETEFSDLARRDGDLVQEVELVGPDGARILALYTMQRMPDGRWLIAACMLVPSARLGV